MIQPEEFFEILQEGATDENLVKLGTIDPAYTSGRPKIKFDNESAISSKSYPYFSSYTPIAGDRVMLIKAGHTWVVMSKII